MGTGKFVTVYPGVWTEREKPYAEEYFSKIKELEDRGPIDVQALISGKIEKGTQGFSNVLEVKEDMMLYNAKKYDPDNKLYTDDAYAKSLGYAGKIAMPAFAAHDDSFLTAFNGKARDFLAVTGLHHEIEQLAPVYAGDTLYLVKDKLELVDLTPKEGSIYRNLVLKCTGSVYNQKGEKVLGVMFSARENLKSYEDPADMTPRHPCMGKPPTGGHVPFTATPTRIGSRSLTHGPRRITAVTSPFTGRMSTWAICPNVTIDGPIHASCNPTPPYGMAVGGSRTMKELSDPEVRAKMTRDPKYGVYVPADMKEWDPEVPPYDDPRAKMGPPPGAGAPPKEEKRSIFINFLGRDFAIHHINNWMGSHGWIQNIRWGIMTDPTEQGFCFPKNTAVCEMIEKIPAMAGKKCNTHGLQYDVMKIHSQVYDKYEKDGKHYVELGFWINHHQR